MNNFSPTSRTRFTSCLGICLLAVIASGVAAPKFSSSTGYQFSDGKKTVTLKAGTISNSSAENTTGSLKVQLWATNDKYTGGTIRGTLIGDSGKIKGLGPGQYYSDLQRNVKTRLPGEYGNYNLALVLLEYRAEGYVIVDSRNMASRVTLGPKPKLFELRGPWTFRWSREGGTVAMSVAKISHTRSGRTGTLKLAVWLTQSPYRGRGNPGLQDWRGPQR